MGRESKNDMERIQKGLEEFLEQEVPGYRQMESKERDAVKIDILNGNSGQNPVPSYSKTTVNKARTKTPQSKAGKEKKKK